MAIAFAQSKSSGSTAVSQSLTLNNNVGSGSLLLVSCRDGTSSANPTITDDRGGVWTKATNVGNVGLWYALTTSAGSCTITITAAGTTSFRFTAHEFTGTFSSPLSGTPATTAPATAPASPVTGNQTTTGAALLFSVFGSSTTWTSLTVASPWTLGPVGSGRVVGAYSIEAAAGTFSATYTQTGASSIGTIIATFVEAPPAAGNDVMLRIKRSQWGRTYF